MFKFTRPSRGSGKTILETQHATGVIFAKDFVQRLDMGERLTEQDFVEGLKAVYVHVGKFFYGGDDDNYNIDDDND